MRLIGTLVWTLACVGVGVALATVEVSGRTPVQHAERLWRNEGTKKLDSVKDRADDLVDDVKRKVSSTARERPLDKHSAEERSALERLIADRQRDGR